MFFVFDWVVYEWIWFEFCDCGQYFFWCLQYVCGWVVEIGSCDVGYQVEVDLFDDGWWLFCVFVGEIFGLF